MSVLTISPVQWSDVKDIDEIEPLNDGDTGCLMEIRDVLRKHGKMERLGVALLHSHFELATDEIMLETTDSENRTLITQPIKESEAGSKVGTIWMLREGDVTTMAYCESYCYKATLAGHTKQHRRVKE